MNNSLQAGVMIMCLFGIASYFMAENRGRNAFAYVLLTAFSGPLAIVALLLLGQKKVKDPIKYVDAYDDEP